MARSVSQITIPIKYITNTKALGKATGAFAKFGAAVGGIAAVSVAAVAGIGAAAVKMSSEFETSFAKIQGLVGVAAGDLGELKEAAARLGPQFGKSANEAADALFFITSAGLRGAAATEVLEASLKGAAIGLGDTKTIADLATSAVNAYGEAQLGGAQAVDVLAEAVRLGKLEPEELAQSMGQVLPIASNLGVSFQEVGAAMAGMSKTGTNASIAATQLRGILNTLAKPTNGAKNALAGMGLSAEGLRQQIKDKGLFSTLETLTDKFDGNIEATTSVFGNVRALSGVLDLMGASVDDNRKLFEQMTDEIGVLDEAFEITADTVKFKFDRALETTKASLLPVGDILLDIVGTLLDSLMPTIDKLGPIFEETFAAFAPALDGLFQLLPGLIDAFLPLLPIMGDIAAIVVDLVTSLLPPFITLLDALMPVVEMLVETFAKLIGPLVEMLVPVLGAIFESVDRILQAALPVFVEMLDALIPIVLELVEMFLPLIDIVLPLLEAVLIGLVIPALGVLAEMMTHFLPQAMEVFKEIGLGRLLLALGTFANDFDDIVFGIRTFFAAGFNIMLGALEKFINASIRGLNWFIEKANSLPGVEIDFRASEINFDRIAMPGRFDNMRFGDVDTSGTRDVLDRYSARQLDSGGGGNRETGGGQSIFSPGVLQETAAKIALRDRFGINMFQGANASVSAFAKGGIVTGPTVGLVGEAGPEAIIPLSRAGGLGGTYNITVNAGMGADGQRIGEQIIKEIKRYERQSGPVFARA